MTLIASLYIELISTLSRAITGRLFTDEQIKSITSGATGKYFADFFPTPKDAVAVEHKVETARKHIAAASGGGVSPHIILLNTLPNISRFVV
jgi:hypothetical protein